MSYRLALAALLGLSFQLWAQMPRLQGSESEQQPRQIATSVSTLPISFEVNNGQTDSLVQFLARGPGYALFLTPEEAVLSLREPLPNKPKAGHGNEELHGGVDTIRLRLAGARTPAKLEPLDPLPNTSNYFSGNNPLKWHTAIPNYSKIRYREVYSGIDLVYYGKQAQLEYDFVIAPGADPKTIAMDVAGARTLKLDTDGNLILNAGSRALVLHKPITYQDENGRRTPVPAAYRIDSHKRVSFEVGKYDKSKTLVIDPVLIYSTFVGTSQFDFASSIAVDAAGNAYITGMTVTPDFPTVTPVQPANAGANDAFIAKLNATGDGLVYATFLGGTGTDIGNSIAIDPVGNAYVAGETASTDFPLVNALQKICTNCGPTVRHAFVAKINAAGNALIYSTYLGGTTAERAVAIAADSAGNAYVAGDTFSTDFPVTAGALQTACAGGQGGCLDGFITKVNADGSALSYSTYLGATLDDHITAIAVDATGNAYLTGNTISNNFPTTPGAFISKCDLATLCNAAFANAFVTKLNPTGTALVYSTYLGGSFGGDGGTGIAVDAAGNAYVTGGTSALDFPVTLGVIQPHCTLSSEVFTAVCDGDAFVTKLSADGSRLIYSTYLGGDFIDSGSGIAVNSAGEAYIVGGVLSGDFPVLSPMQPCAATGETSGFLAKLNVDATALSFSTCLGGLIGNSFLTGIALDAAGNAYLSGATQQIFPTTAGAFSKSGPGSLVIKVSPENASAAAFSNVTPGFTGQTVAVKSDPQAVTLCNMGSAALNITGITTSGDFAQTNTCGSSLPGGKSCTINITFTPTSTGSRSGVITIADNAADSPQHLTPSGIGINPIVSLSSTSLTFPSTPIGVNAPLQTVTLSNNGIGPLSPVHTLGGSGDFFGTDDCLLLVPQGGSCTITIRFNPSAGGVRNGVITISDNAFDTPQQIAVTGSSTGPGFQLSASSINFPNQAPGTKSAPQAIMLTNNGTAALAISGIAAQGPFSTSTDCGTSLAINATCTINVTFAPPAAGTFQGTLLISDNLPASPQSIFLNGVSPGTPAAILSGNSLSFGTVLEGTHSVPQSIQLTNNGTAPLNISSIALVGTGYTVAHNCGSVMLAGDRCFIDVRFVPSFAGTNTTRVDITDDASPSTQSFTVTGVGTEFVLAPATNSVTNVTVNAGQTANYSLALQPSGTTRDTVTLTCTGTVPLGTCGVNPSLVTFTSVSAAPINVTISTKAASAAAVPVTYPADKVRFVWLFIMITSLSLIAAAMGRMTPRRRALAISGGLSLIFVVAVSLSGCGGGGGSGGGGTPPPPPVPGTPAGTYSFTITAKSASSVNPDQNVNLVLNVK